MRPKYCLLFLCACLSAATVQAQIWEQPLRGSWLATATDKSNLVLVSNDVLLDIVVTPRAHSAVLRAAEFLASDIEKITGRKPEIVTRPRRGIPSVRLVTVGQGELPQTLNSERLRGKWEAYTIQSTQNSVWLVGSNPRGTAFAAYTLSERIGIDPLYHWTGYEPNRQNELILKSVHFEASEPTFKYRGLFHDDEDTLPMPLDKNGYPQYAGGLVPAIWYERYFETALRLRLNQVAPFVRVIRPFEIQKMASDWGLFYSSHHYDILLSNPFGYERFGLAQERGVSGDYDWSTNRKGILEYWKAGIEENKDLDTIWPVGLRGTADTAYKFKEGTTQAQKNEVFVQAIRDQVNMTNSRTQHSKTPVFHFTLYGEMLKSYQSGNFEFPEEVILVWNDTGDGIMRALPESLGKWKHGVYYHLAYYGATTKQTHHTIQPQRIEAQFRSIVNAGATEYLLLNVSELREYVMNTRFIADIAWDASAAFSQPDAANRFVDWWAQEYFGDQAKEAAVDSYHAYFEILHSHDQILEGAQSLDNALHKFAARLRGDHHIHYTQDDLNKLEVLEQRLAQYKVAFEKTALAKNMMNAQQSRFFFENLELGLFMDYYPTQAAALINKGLRKYPDNEALANVHKALETLENLEQALTKAEREPFKNWYRNTWIRRVDSNTNPHFSYYRIKSYLDNNVPRYQ